jgi:hypothetical protein
MPEDAEAGDNMAVLILLALAIFILGGAGFLARRNLRVGRGDRRGAAQLAVWMSAVMMALWICQVHLVASLGLLAMFLLALSTSASYGLLLWTIYVALEPFVRRHWPQVLVSWTTVASGRVRDAVVGRDVLIGAALGVAWVLMVRAVDMWSGDQEFATFPGSMELLRGVRATIGVVLEQALYALRNVLLFFFLLFVLRVVLRNQWAAVIAFATIFPLLDFIGPPDEHRLAGAVVSFLYFGTGAFVVLRWGLVSYAVAMFVSALLVNAPATLDTSALYFGNMLLLVGLTPALAAWGLHTSVGGKLWRSEGLR